jgi:hypothetical protein
VVSTPPTPPDRPRRADDLDDPTGMRALLGSLPEPGPMPADLVARITASLASEQQNRESNRTVVPLHPRQHRWRRAALVAAAAAVVAVGVPALLTGSGPGDIAALLTRQDSGDSASSAKSASDSGGSAYSESSPTTGTRGSSVPGPSVADGASAAALTAGIYASGTAYTTASLASQLQAFAARPGTPVQPKAAEEPALGLVATSAGLLPCLRTLGVASGDRVTADVATYNGAPAVVIVVSRPSGRQGYVLSRDCATTPSTPLAGPVPLG